MQRGEERRAARAEKAAEKQRAKAEREEQARNLEAANLETYGRLVRKDNAGFKTIAIYDRGYVRVGVGLGPTTPYEKLLGIHFSRTVQDKSSGGRAAGALATGGVSLLTNSRERRDVYLTITTDVTVHQLKAQGAAYERGFLALEGAGLAVIESNKSASAAPQTPSAPHVESGSLADELAKLATLKESGVLSDDEFAAAKARLLSQ